MPENETLHSIILLIIQLAIIIFASWTAKYLSDKCNIPHVIGYLIIGIIIGPFFLGGLPLTSYFKEGLFPVALGSNIPVSPYLYGLSTIASILLLFLSGLETDTVLFVKYAVKGTIVGLGGLIVSFAGGYLVSIIFTNHHLLHPIHLFMGTIATATSVGISSSILSNQSKINSPEGLIILSAAVLDDVLGIVVLAIVLGITDILIQNQNISINIFYDVGIIAIRAVGLWLVCTVIGILFSKKFGKGIKKIFKDDTSITLIAMACALLLGGVFEILGLSMIIGAYIIGLTLSNTDLSYIIQEKITPIASLFIPIFFIVTGMSINVREILHWNTIVIGLVYSIVSIFAKIIGTGLPAYMMGFNVLGSLRIGLGMAPRGEIAIIITGLGMSSGIINDTIFGAILIMIISSSILAPIVLNQLMANPKQGTKKKQEFTLVQTVFDFKTEMLTRLLLSDFISLLLDEKYYISKISKGNQNTYHIRKDDVNITLSIEDFSSKLIFQTDNMSIAFIKTVLYEASTNIAESSLSIKESLNPMDVVTSETKSYTKIALEKILSSSLVSLQLVSDTKEGVIKELIEMLEQDSLVLNKEQFFNEVIEREKSFSTGLQEGVAMPHAKSNAIRELSIVIGLKPEGLDFNSLDHKLSKIFVLIAAPINTPHLEILTQLSTLLNQSEFRQKILTCTKKQEIVSLFSTHD